MGDVSVMARRLDRNRVQYGWSGNGGYYRNTGNRLLSWYNDPELVDYLFGLGQTALIGRPGSENGGQGELYTHDLEGTPCWLGKTEREIFKRIAFVDYGYFYDLDNRWYYINPGPFRIKIPLDYIDGHLDEEYREYDELRRIEQGLVDYILGSYYESDQELQARIDEKYPQSIDFIREDVLNKKKSREQPCVRLWEKYRSIFHYFDDWAVVRTKDNEISEYVVRRKQNETTPRIETIDW